MLKKAQRYNCAALLPKTNALNIFKVFLAKLNPIGNNQV